MTAWKGRLRRPSAKARVVLLLLQAAEKAKETVSDQVSMSQIRDSRGECGRAMETIGV